MEAKFKLMILILLVVMIPVGVFVPGLSYYLMPVFTFIIIGMLAYEYLVTRLALKNGKAIRLGKGTIFSWLKFFCLFGGIGIIVLDVRFQAKLSSSWGVSSGFYLGLISIAYALLSVKNNVILFKEKGQKRTYYWTESSYWIGPLFSFSKIEKVKIGTNQMVVSLKTGDMTHDFVDDNQRTAVQQFLRNGFADKLVFGEDAVNN